LSFARIVCNCDFVTSVSLPAHRVPPSLLPSGAGYSQPSRKQHRPRSPPTRHPEQLRCVYLVPPLISHIQGMYCSFTSTVAHTLQHHQIDRPSGSRQVLVMLLLMLRKESGARSRSCVQCGRGPSRKSTFKRYWDYGLWSYMCCKSTGCIHVGNHRSCQLQISLPECRRVVLLNRDAETGEISLRHYAVAHRYSACLHSLSVLDVWFFD
jgi:hypothetical protein